MQHRIPTGTPLAQIIVSAGNNLGVPPRASASRGALPGRVVPVFLIPYFDKDGTFFGESGLFENEPTAPAEQAHTTRGAVKSRQTRNNIKVTRVRTPIYETTHLKVYVPGRTRAQARVRSRDARAITHLLAPAATCSPLHQNSPSPHSSSCSPACRLDFRRPPGEFASAALRKWATRTPSTLQSAEGLVS